MNTDLDTDSAVVLRSLMQTVSIPSYRALATQANVSRWQVQQLSSGNLTKMRIDTVAQIAKALNISLPALLQRFLSSPAASTPHSATAEPVSQNTQPKTSQTESSQIEALQTEALQILETWLVQWPTIAKRAEDNPSLSAAKILPFVRPVEQLMQSWQVEPIAAIDEKVTYNPQYHQLVKGLANPQDLVQVTHTGQRHRGKLLHRAKVKSINS